MSGLVTVRYVEDTPTVRLDHGMKNAYTPKKVGGAVDPSESHRGDVEAGLKEADSFLEETYNTPFQTRNPMEPHATIAVSGLVDYSDRRSLCGSVSGSAVEANGAGRLSILTDLKKGPAQRRTLIPRAALTTGWVISFGSPSESVIVPASQHGSSDAAALYNHQP